MNYQEFRNWRDGVLKERDLLRLDCMNPAKALASLAPPATEHVASPSEALAAWRTVMGEDLDPERMLATTGVRPALRLLWAHLATHGYALWLPADVYPEYAIGATAQGLPWRSFETLPHITWPDWDSVPRQALLIPNPLPLHGRALSVEEVDTLQAWLAADPERRLILDTVYHLETRLAPSVRALWEGGQTYVVHSLAKAWLLPDTLGVTLTPPHQVPTLSRLGQELPPDAAGRAVVALSQWTHVPEHVAATFPRQWAALAPRLRHVWPEWQPPQMGYFHSLPVPFQALVERHGMLAVAPSVFGSQRRDLSVVSCLYYPA